MLKVEELLLFAQARTEYVPAEGKVTAGEVALELIPTPRAPMEVAERS